MRTRLGTTTAIVLSAALLAACSGGAEGPKGAGTVSNVPVAANFDENAEFSWGYVIEVTSFDPHRGSSGFDQSWLAPVYDRLVFSGPDGRLQPMLATSWEVNEEGTELTLKLREGVTFHDGTPMDAAAVKTSLDRARDDESVVKSDLASVKNVEVTDDHTVKLTLDGGAGALLGALSDRAGMIISPAAIKKGGLDHDPVGAGPYKVLEHRQGDRVVYGRTGRYWDPNAQRVAKMTFRVIGDDQTRLNALQAGELDVVMMRGLQVEPAKRMGMNVLAGRGPSFFQMSVNTAKKPFGDKRVRLALNLAMDRKAIGDGLHEGYCVPQVQFWPANSWAYDKKLGNGLDRWPHDPAQAKKLLAEAGYPKGFSFTLTVSNITAAVSAAEALQAQFAKVGVTMKVQVVDASQVGKVFLVEKTAEAQLGTAATTPDPQGVLDRTLLSGATGNPGGKAGKKVEELSEKARDAVTEEERAPFYHQISEELIDYVPHVMPICMQDRVEGFRDGVSGLAVYAGGGREFRGVAVGKGD